jgi:hypothetical protein
VRQTGLEGEELSGINPAAKVRIPSMTGTASCRIPDSLTDTSLIEVKNVANLSYTSQLQDFSQFAIANNLSFNRIVRSDTMLSGTLGEMLSNGSTTLSRSLP